MDDIKTLAEEAKRLARDFAAAHLRETLAEATGRLTLANSEEAEAAMDAAIDALAEAHQAEVARLTRENEGLAKDAARLDWMIEAGGFIVWTVRDGTIRQCQVWTQDEDEAFHQPAGEARFFNTTRDAIDAALAGASGADEGERT